MTLAKCKKLELESLSLSEKTNMNYVIKERIKSWENYGNV